MFRIAFMKQVISLFVLSIAIRAAYAEPQFDSLPDVSGRYTNAPSPDSAVTPTNSNPLLLPAVLHEVLIGNPSLKASRANWEAMKQRVPQARAWEDLRGGFDTVAGRFVDIPRNSFTDQKVMLEQTVPVTGKNRLRGEAAEAEAIAAYQDVKRRELDLTAKAKMAFYQLANANEQLRIIDSNLELLRQFTRTSRSKYEAGIKPQSDVLTAETDASKLEESRYDILRQISEAQSQLNVLMNRPAQAPVGKPASLGFPTMHFELDQLQALALTNRPEVLGAARKIEAAQARLEAARREWIPEPNLRVEASRYNDAGQAISEVMAGVSVNIPWLNRRKYKAAIEEANQMKASAEYELEAARNETLGLVRDALIKVETYHHHVELFRDRILTLARQNASATRLAYETDRTSFLNLIDAQRTLQEVEGMYWSHLTDFLTALAELQSVIGADPATAHTLNTNHKHE
jgi:cobalt-zinc-cadmium efflux system outer membrane protein